MPLESYLKKGLLKRQRVNFRQIEKQIVRAKKDLDTAQTLLAKDPEWAATIAYHAMLRAGRALLFSSGYLPADGGQHRTVVELTHQLLGKDDASLVERFEKMRRKRNIFFYESDPFTVNGDVPFWDTPSEPDRPEMERPQGLPSSPAPSCSTLFQPAFKLTAQTKWLRLLDDLRTVIGGRPVLRTGFSWDCALFAHKNLEVTAPLGLEPRYPDPESGVLPIRRQGNFCVTKVRPNNLFSRMIAPELNELNETCCFSFPSQTNSISPALGVKPQGG